MDIYCVIVMCDFTEANTMLFSDALNKDYEEYQNNKKEEIDAILRRYIDHNNALHL